VNVYEDNTHSFAGYFQMGNPHAATIACMKIVDADVRKASSSKTPNRLSQLNHNHVTTDRAAARGAFVCATARHVTQPACPPSTCLRRGLMAAVMVVLVMTSGMRLRVAAWGRRGGRRWR
jgi:hypothetical protein